MVDNPEDKTPNDVATVRIMAVKRPATGVDIPEERLSKSPYITQDQLADWLGVAVGDLDEESSPEQQLAVGLAIQARMNEGIDVDALQFLGIMQSETQSQMFDGAYAPTKGNPVFAIEAFLDARRLGLYPPGWVLEWLGRAFHAYALSEGKEDLGKLLGVKRGKGETPIFKEASDVVAESNLMTEMGILTTAGATIMEAAEMVAARHEEKDPDFLSPDTLAERYSKRGWSKLFKPVKALSPALSPEDMKDAFSAYPPHSVPPKFK